MPYFAFCTDTTIAPKVRVEAFRAHAQHVRSVIAGIAFAAPLASMDLDVSAGDDRILSSIFGVTSSAAALKSLMAADPYFIEKAWNPIDVYATTAAVGLWAQTDLTSGDRDGRLYAALFEEADARHVDMLAAGLGSDLRIAATLQMCDTLGDGLRAATWRVIAVFKAHDLTSAKNRICALDTAESTAAMVLSIPKSAGFWIGNLSAGEIEAEIYRVHQLSVPGSPKSFRLRGGSVCLHRLAARISGSPLVDHAAAGSD